MQAKLCLQIHANTRRRVAIRYNHVLQTDSEDIGSTYAAQACRHAQLPALQGTFWNRMPAPRLCQTDHITRHRSSGQINLTFELSKRGAVAEGDGEIDVHLHVGGFDVKRIARKAL